MILINLLPPELRKKEAPKIVMPEIPIKKALVAIGVLLLLVQVLLSLAAVFFGYRQASMKKEISRLTGETRQTDKLRTETMRSQDKLKDIRLLTGKNFYWTLVLNSVSSSVTKGIWLRGLALTEVTEESSKAGSSHASKDVKKESSRDKAPAVVKALKLEGSVVAPGQETAFIGKYVKSLKEEPVFTGLFRDVELDSINQRKIKEFDIYDFTLLCKFRKEKI